MTIFVADCSQWTGFHITTALLEAGKSVDGGKMDTEAEDLSMFFDRNSHFNFVEADTRKSYEIAILIGNHYASANIDAKHLLIIQPSSKKFVSKGTDNSIVISVPLLFGERMLMNEEGIYQNGEFIPFDSAYFQDEAIYIEDFTKALMQWMNSTFLRQKLKVRSPRSNESNDENTIHVRMTKPIETRLQEMLM